ncbi:MAG TPA: DUF1549 domain-containing protein [Tepidisphaeraceae bacterium]|nr:DUF1549 domain-containing protein [Tepidisphaeraceae bacterium]
MRLVPTISLAIFVSLVPAAPLRAQAAPVDFTRDIRPILANNCLKCHGVDDKARKGNLRLDVRESAIAPAKSGDLPIVPGKPDKSELIRRINAANPDDQMPPPATKLVLTEAQKQMLGTWISQGAKYAPHWAFVAPKAGPLPAVKDAAWCRNPIDRFVLARLEQEGLKPSPEADKLTLARRVYLDLIGLPPTPAEADAFANDPSPDAYEKLVDRLLASPQYGERWARRWLDLARYSDTNGYEKDRPRSIWPYRDWIINSLNADMPFDEFTIEQIAGDMLPSATPSQKIATGFHRNTMLNEEGGIDPLEYRYYAMVDRVATTGTTWLGLTIACAQCHTHKYDPIRNKEYYQFMALMDNTSEPRMDLPSPEIAAAKKAADEKIAKLTAELPEKFPVGNGNVTWEIAGGNLSASSGALASKQADGSWKFTGPAPLSDTYTLDFDSADHDVDRIRLQTIRDGKHGPGLTPHGNFVLSEISATVKDTDGGGATPVKLIRAEADFSQRNYPVEHAIDGDPSTGWAIDEPGKGPQSRTATFYFDKPTHLPHGGHWTIKLEQNYGEKHVIGHFRLSLGHASADAGPLEVRRKEAFEKSFAHWQETAAAAAVKWTVLRPAEMKSSKPILTLQKDDSVLASGDITKRDTYDLTFHTNLKGITGVRLEALPDESLPNNGPGMVFYEGALGDFSLSEITLSAGGKPGKFIRADQTFAAGGSPASAAIDGNPQTGWMINGGQGKAHQAIFILSEPTGDANDLTVRLLFERYFAAALGHFRISVTTDPRVKDDHAMPGDVEDALASPADQRTASQRESLLSYYLETAPELAAARKEIDRVRDSVPRPVTTLVMRERLPGQQRITHVHHRGEFLSTEEAVTGDVPAFLPPLPANVPHDRLALARWLVSPENPLTARVTVNRQWQAFFGRGIVSTTGDFGYQGDLPANQDLLDWMAVQFMKPVDQGGCGWSLKKLDRLIVTSAAYRQSARVTPELLARDPQNLLLARGPRFRVEAEVLRDSALKESGLLTEKIGGPSVFPPQPASVTTEGAYGPMQWNPSTGPDRYRRSLYTFSKRTAPFAMYIAFDAPAGDVCTGRRDVSNSPLQALTMMNDAVFVEAAQALGKSIAQMKDATDEIRATAIFRRCLTRTPDADELAALLAFVKSQRQRIAAKELNSAEIAGGRDGDVTERAVWTAVSRAVMNLDEAMTD